MKTIFDDEDLYYTINISSENDNGGQPIFPQDLPKFEMDFYTTDQHSPITFTAEDCVDDVLYINSSQLKKLKTGSLKVRFRLALEDENYEDGTYDVTIEKMTGWFLKNVNPNDKK